MIIRQLFDRESSTYTYLLADSSTHQAALVDPVRGQLERDLQLVAELGLTLTHVLETHVHADHVTSAGLLRERTGARTHASASGAPCVDVHLRHGDVVRVGDLVVTALATPGHTDDGMSFVVGGHVLTGDTLLIRGCGRADFQNGDPETLYDSIVGVLFALPDATLVLPGHDYKGMTTSTIVEERRLNPRIAGKSKAELVAIMRGLDLPPPKQIDVAVAANRACGELLSPSPSSSLEGKTTMLHDLATENPLGYRDATVADVFAAKGHVRMIDVREPDEYTGELGHIEGAELVPLATVAGAAQSWDRQDALVLVCRSGGRSGKAAATLASMGFTQVVNMSGGMLAVNAAKLAVVR